MKKSQKQSKKIDELKKAIISNAKDARQTEKLLTEALRMQKSEVEMNRILDVPLSEVKRELDLGANKLYQTIRGYLWECKGGSYTFVEHRMSRVCALLNTLFHLDERKDESEESKELYEHFSAAVQYVMQSYIFASLDEKTLFSIATSILTAFNDYAEENYKEVEQYQETEQDIIENAELDKASKAVEEILKD